MKNRGLITAAALLITLAVMACKADPQAEARKYVAKGNQQITERKFAEAVIEYRRAVQADPRLGEARLQLASAYASAGDGPNALKEYARAADLMPDDNATQLKAGSFMLFAGRYQDAQGVAARMLKREPTNVDAQIMFANSLAGLKDMDGAIAAFEKAVDMDPTRATSYSDLGSARLVTGDVAAAEAAFRKAIEIAPNSVNAHLSLANFHWAVNRMPEAEREIKAALAIDARDRVANRALAMLYLVTGKAEEAEPHLKLVAEVTPGPEAKYFLSEYFLRLGRVDEARATLTPLVADNDWFVPASIRLARIEVVGKRNTEAHRLIEAVLAREPKNVEALITRGRLHLSEGNTIGALTALQSAVEANPRSLEAQLGLAQTYVARGQTKEATTAFNDAITLDGRSIEARLGLARLMINTGTPADAVTLVSKVVAERPQHIEARLMLVHGLIAVRDIPQATANMDVLLKQAPHSATVQTAAGMLATVKQDSEGARRAYQLALDADPRSYQALAGLLNSEMAGQKFGSAKALIEKQLAQMPNDPNVLLMAAQTLTAMGDAEGAERTLKKTVDLDPGSLQAYAMLGKMYYQQGRLDMARKELEVFANKQPNSVPAQTMLGTILQLQNQTDQAKDRYGRALKIDPRAAVAANNLAWLNANTNGNLDVALQLAQSAKSQLPNRHEVDDTLGWIYYKKGLSSMAIDALSQSTSRQPDNPNYLYHLALAYHQSGDKEKARSHLEKALNSGANFEGAGEARKLLETIKG